MGHNEKPEKCELEWEMRIFKLFAIIEIVFALIVLRCALGIGGAESLFMQVEIPSMCLSLALSLVILSCELAIWYIVRVKNKDLSALIVKKR